MLTFKGTEKYHQSDIALGLEKKFGFRGLPSKSINKKFLRLKEGFLISAFLTVMPDLTKKKRECKVIRHH